MTGEELSRELDRRLGELGFARRRRTGATAAGLRALFAIGHARLGNHARAQALVGVARRQHDYLEGYGYVNHTWLLAALVARVEQAIAGLPVDAGFAAPLEQRFAAMYADARDDLARLRAVSRMLEPVPYVAGAPAREAADPPAALDAIDAALEAAPGERALVDVLTALRRFDEHDAMPLVARAVAQIAAPQLAARAAALVTAARFGWGELVQGLVPPLLDAVADRPHAPEVWFAVSTTMRALRRLGDTDQLRRLIDRTTRGIGGAVTAASTHVTVLLDRDGDRREELRFALAGAATTLGDGAAVDVLQRATRIRTTNAVANLALHRRLCHAYAHGVPEHGIRGLRTLVADFAAAAAHSTTITSDEIFDLVDAQVWAITMLA